MDFQHDLKTFSPSVNADGSVHISYAGSVVLVPKIDFNALVRSKGAMKEYKEALQTAKEDVKNDYLTSHRGGWDKVGCGERADAEILAAAVHGASLSELQKRRFTYDRGGHKKVYGRSKIFSALSVKKPEDYKRIMNLYSAYPEVFNCSAEVVKQWYSKKRGKGGKMS